MLGMGLITEFHFDLFYGEPVLMDIDEPLEGPSGTPTREQRRRNMSPRISETNDVLVL